MEPFFLPLRGEMEFWAEDLGPKIQIIRRLAREYEAIYIPLDGIFASAATMREQGFWAEDGVHPSRELIITHMMFSGSHLIISWFLTKTLDAECQR